MGTEKLLVPDMPPDAIVDIPGEGRFYNDGAKWIPDEVPKVAPKVTPISESDTLADQPTDYTSPVEVKTKEGK